MVVFLPAVDVSFLRLGEWVLVCEADEGADGDDGDHDEEYDEDHFEGVCGECHWFGGGLWLRGCGLGFGVGMLDHGSARSGNDTYMCDASLAV